MALKHPCAILFNVPNSIGFLRVILLLLALTQVHTNPLIFFIFYVTSVILDAFDGHAARIFNQSSQFGSFLDMITDRFSSSCLLSVLCTVLPKYLALFQLLFILDITSHWAHMFASLTEGQQSHKNVDPEHGGRLLHLYYANKIFLFLACFCEQSFYVSIYILTRFYHDGTSGNQYLKYFIIGLLFLSVPLWAVKQLLNWKQLVHASLRIINSDLIALENKSN